MEFPVSKNLMSSYIGPFYNKNVRKYIKSKKAVIYLPNNCSDQMAEMTFKYAQEVNKDLQLSGLKKLNRRSKNGEPPYTVYKFDVQY